MTGVSSFFFFFIALMLKYVNLKTHPSALMQHAIRKATGHWNSQINVVIKKGWRSICPLIVVEWKYKVAENGNTQVKYKCPKLDLRTVVE